jgi:hypothetical protein
LLKLFFYTSIVAEARRKPELAQDGTASWSLSIVFDKIKQHQYVEL